MQTGTVTNSGLRAEWEQPAGRRAQPAASPASSPQMRKLEHAAAEFEGILLSSLWRAWDKSDRMGNRHDAIGDSMTAMGMEMASIAMAEKGGIGIARMIVNSLKGEVAGQPENRVKNFPGLPIFSSVKPCRSQSAVAGRPESKNPVVEENDGEN